MIRKAITIALIAWSATVPGAIWAAHKLGIWNLDVFMNGVSSGLLMAILFYKLTAFTERLGTPKVGKNDHGA